MKNHRNKLKPNSNHICKKHHTFDLWVFLWVKMMTERWLLDMFEQDKILPTREWLIWWNWYLQQTENSKEHQKLNAAAQLHSKCKYHVLSNTACLHYWFSFHPVDGTEQWDLSEREIKEIGKRVRDTEKCDAVMETDVLCIWTIGNSI